MQSWLRKMLNASRGATATEYGIVAAGVALAIAAAVVVLGDDLNRLLGGVSGSLDSDAGDAASSGPIGFDALVGSMEVAGAGKVSELLQKFGNLSDTKLQEKHAKFASDIEKGFNVPWVRDRVRILDELLAERGLAPLPPEPPAAP